MSTRSGLWRDPRLWLVAAALFALGIRLVAIAWWSHELPLEGDQLFYHHQGQDLADGTGFTYRHPAGERITTAVHPPMHGGILGVASLVGADSAGAHRFVGALLGAATALIGGLAARRLAGDRAGVVAAVVLACTPTLWINDALVLSESSYAFAVSVVLLASVELARRADAWRAAALGAAVGLAMLSRAEAALLVVVLVAPMMLWALPDRTRSGLRWRLRLSVWAAIGFVLVAGPWLGRNLVSFERPVTVSSGGGFVLEIANCDATYYGDDLGWWSVSCDRTPWQPGDETATEAAKRETGLAYIRDNTSRLPVVIGARIARMWDIGPPEQSVRLNNFFERRGERTSRAAIYYWWAMLPFVAVGLWSLRRRELILPYVSIAVVTTVAAALSFGITRYRTGLEVAVAVLAGIGLVVLARRCARTADPQAEHPEDVHEVQAR